MMRFRHACTAMQLLVPALVTLTGCATHTTRVTVTRVVHLQPPKRSSDEIPSARQPVKARPSELVATTQPEPCVFRGSLRTTGLLYPQATGGQGIVQLSGYDVVQIDRLELPTAPDERAKVVVTSPIQIEAYIEENEKVVQIDTRVDIVPGHVWLDQRRPVRASLGSGGTAEINEPFSDGTSPPEFVTSVMCADLSLPQSYYEKPTPPGESIHLQSERIPIHESAGGREVAAIQGRDGYERVVVSTIERVPGWLHVEGNEEFHFNGWIPASSEWAEQGFGIIGLLTTLDVTHQVTTHQVTTPIPLRIEATDAAPVIAKAAKDAEILITPGPPGYRKIQFGVGVSTSFFAREVELRGAVRLADGVEPGEPESKDPQEEASSANTDTTVPSAVPSTPMPPPAAILRPSIEKTWDIAEVPVHASLEEGARLIRKGDWAGASKVLSTDVKKLSDGDFEARIVGYALLGRACDRKGDEPCAKTAYTKVLELAKNSEAKIKAVFASHRDAATNMVARLLLAQGEALFYKAEQKRKAADAMQYPIYRGSGDRDDLLQHINTKVIDWIKKKRPLLEEAEQAYAEILELEPAPPPAWVVIAAGRSGDIWSAFVYEFQTLAPLPSEWNGAGTVPGTDLTYEELRREYRKKLEEGIAPQRQHAAEAYKSCRDHAKKHGVAATEGKRCEERLTAMGATP